MEKMFCREKQSVAARALIRPETSKDSSVTVASSTPPMMGMSDMYTCDKDHTETHAASAETNTNQVSKVHKCNLLLQAEYPKLQCRLETKSSH